MDITQLKISDQQKIEYLYELIIEWKEITSVTYIVSELDIISNEKFGYDYHSFLKYYGLQIDKIESYLECFKSEGILCIDWERNNNIDHFTFKLKNISQNYLNILNLLEYLKNLLFDADFIKKTKNDVPNTKKQKLILSFEAKVNKFLSFLNFTWTEIKYNNIFIKIIDSKNLMDLLDLNSIDSLDVTTIEWKEVISEFMKKTTIREADHTKILRLISPTAEKYRKQIESKNKDVEKELFKNLNNLCIRHDNSWEKIKSIYHFTSKDDYFLKIKQTFQLFLLAMIIIDE